MINNEFDKVFNKNSDNKLVDSMKIYLKLAFILYESEFAKIYDENYNFIGKIPNKNKTKIDPEEPEKTIDVEKPKEHSTFIIAGLDFNLTYKGEKLASKSSGGFFFLYNKKGIDIFEYFTDDIFFGFDEKRELILFKEKTSGIIYGKGFDGRRFETSKQPNQNLNQKQTSTSNIELMNDKPELSDEQIIKLIIDRFKKIIIRNKIQADLLISKKLDTPEMYNILLKVYNGDLSQLNEDIKEAKLKGINVSITTGFSSPKVALLHELFINTTLTGRGGHRGKNMRAFIVDLIILDQYGKLSPIKKLITPKSQEKGIDFFKQLSLKYKDKSEVILKVYKCIKFDDEYLALINMNKNVDMNTYKAFLISKLYEYTTRIDRGNGISIMNVSKALMDIK